jgi:ATPase subunit of ABC transporter with duplicated ATPase domains
MIRIENISKSNSHRILYIEASAALNRGEKIGLVGPNGAGKTTLFRMITGTDLPDEGQVSVERGVTIGYFDQDVGEMSGRSAVAEVIDGAGPVSEIAAELHELEAAMSDPKRMDEMDAIIERYGEVQARYEQLDGYALEGRAREVLAGLSFSQEMMDGRACRARAVRSAYCDPGTPQHEARIHRRRAQARALRPQVRAHYGRAAEAGARRTGDGRRQGRGGS